MVLPFEEQILSDLLSDPINGSLTIISSGLPLHSLISSLLLLLHHPSNGCCLIISASPSQKLSIRNPNPNSPIPDITPYDNRASLYASGGSFFVTPRILIADLLTNRVPPNSISSIVVLNAHNLTDTSTEMFIARVVKTKVSRNTKIYAFSDRPYVMVSGFAKAERIMKGLYVRRMHLWPRFHVMVGEDLEKEAPEVVDVRVGMSGAMKGMQKAVLEAMGACLKELRKTNKVDVEDLTVEKGLFKSFDEIVRRQLDPIWHTIGKKTKQLVSDLTTLRKLLDYLVR